MKSILNLAFFLGLTALIVQCKTDSKTQPRVDIHIADAKNLKVFLDRTQISNETEIITEAQLDGSGKAQLDLPPQFDRGLYRIRIGAKKHQLVLDGTEKLISINGSLKDLGHTQLSVTGSPSTEELMEQISLYQARKLDMNAITKYIETAGNPLSSIQFALSTVGSNPMHYQIHENLAARLKDEIGDTKYYQDYAQFATQMANQYKAQMASQRIRVGEEAPEIKMPNLNGKEMSLSSFKGKVVLLDFWASWCGPCRRSNPHLVEVYQKYKNKGFDVFSVSLDGLDGRSRARFANENDPQMINALKKQKERWKGAIEKDNLTWEGHVSELLKWDTPAAKDYGVTGIPKTFLIDRDGKIAAVNPRYNLEEELLKIL